MVGPFLDLLNLPTLLLKNFFFYLKKNNSFQKNFREMSKAKIISFICFVWKSFFLNWVSLFSSQKWEKISLWVFCFSRSLSFSFPGVFAVFVAIKKFIFMTFSVLATNWHSWSYYSSYSTTSTSFYDFLNEWRDLNFPDISVEFH